MSDRTSFLQYAPNVPGLETRFSDLHPALSATAAVAEANRCLFCFDAPCTQACPTHIDVPRFIKKIASGNLEGSAATILEANVLGASCSRACPVSILCEGACVLHRHHQKPIEIGRLQRHAMDTFHVSGAPLPFAAGEPTGLSVALIGAGPASLACAAELRRRGIAAKIFDARTLPGGLNTFGIAEYKLTLRASLAEIDLLAGLGVEFAFDTVIDEAKLAELDATHDAVFIGIGLGAIHRLGVEGETLEGVTDALSFIEGYKRGSIMEAPARVAVVGAGNTAIDAANAAVRLGAREVHMIYRRGRDQMSAFDFEFEHSRQEGVRFLWHAQPVKLVGTERIEAVELDSLEDSKDGSLVGTRTTTTLPVDLLILSIGQSTHSTFAAHFVKTERGRIVVDRRTGQTSNPRFFAGGDCANGGREVVDAVADGKRAGIAMAAWLTSQSNREAAHAHA